MAEGDLTSSSIADVRPESKLNFKKLCAHTFVDFTCFYMYYPVLTLLFFNSTQSIQLILYGSIGLGICCDVVLVAFGSAQEKIHQRTSVMITHAAAALSIALVVASSLHPVNWALAIACMSSVGLYYGFLQITAATITCDSVDVVHPDEDLNKQYTAQIAAPLVATGIILAMFGGLGNEWKEETMRVIILSAISVQASAQLLLFSLQGLRMPPIPETPTTPINTDAGASEKPAISEKNEGKMFFCRSTFWVPLAGALTVFSYSLSDYMCFQYFSYFAMGDLGLTPIQYFGSVLSQLSVALVLSLLFGELATKFPSTKFIFLVQLAAPATCWFLHISGLAHGKFAFVAVVVLHCGFRDSCSGLLRGIVVRHASPSGRIFWNGMGMEGARYFSSLIGLAIGGTVAAEYGFPRILLPTAVVVTAGWLASATLTQAPALDESESARVEQLLAERGMMQALRARQGTIQHNLGTYLKLLKAKRILLAMVQARRCRQISSHDKETTELEQLPSSSN